MSLTSYRAAPPRVNLFVGRPWTPAFAGVTIAHVPRLRGGDGLSCIVTLQCWLLEDLAPPYSPMP